MGVRFVAIAIPILLASFISACKESPGTLVVYSAHDRNLSEPVLKDFSWKTGIKIKAVYDTEANKTTGLVNRLLAERHRPHADVFWNNEIARTIELKQQGLLQPYVAQGADHRADFYRDPEGYWTGMAARARVLIVNTEQMDEDEIPDSLSALTDPHWQGRAAIANPQFGTTGTHFSALLVKWGEQGFRQWLGRLKANQVALLPGNAQVRDQVVAGVYSFGLTDTDDASAAILDDLSVRMVIPDQGMEAMGVFIIPNTVSLIHNSPNSDQARKLVDFLLTSEVESKLAKGRGAQIPLTVGVAGPVHIPSIEELKCLNVDYRDIARRFEDMLKIFREVWYP